MRYKHRTFLSNPHIDWPLFMGLIILLGMGLLILYSAKQDVEVMFKQIVRLGLATFLMLIVAQMPPKVYKMLAPWIYWPILSLLILVLLIGQISKGGQRWLDLWIIRFQPAELMKLAVPLMLAKYLDEQLLPPRLKTLIIPFVIMMVPVALIAKQPDLGTALLIFSTGLFVLFFSGLSWKWIFTLGGSIAAIAPFAWFFLYDYQKNRILTFLDPERDPLGKGYHIIQSKIAIGSGGLYGKGWLQGSQSNLAFLPECTTDSIFAVFGEQFGLIGSILLLSVYLYIIIRGLLIGVQAKETFSRLLAGSLVMTFFVYIFVNVGMVTGILPAVGIPLPLISYGGTSLVTLMIGFGMLMSIQTHRGFLVR
jgi:rod shape determining protein RodA